MDIQQLHTGDEKILVQLNLLLVQLTGEGKKLSLDDLSRILAQENMYLLVAKEEEVVVGMASMYSMNLLNGVNASIEDVVVDEGQRGKGLGRKLMEELIHIAKKCNVHHIDLTSRPERIAANELYKTLGFQRRDTNVYRLYLVAQ